MNKIRKYFYKKCFYVGSDYYTKGYCIAGIIITSKQLNSLKGGKLHNINKVIKYYAVLVKNIIKNKIINYKLSKRNIVFE